MTTWTYRTCIECEDKFRVDLNTERGLCICPRCRMAAVENMSPEWPARRRERERDAELRRLGIGG